MTPRARRYAEEAAARHGVDLDAVLGRDRHKQVCFARWEVMRRLRHDGLSLGQIGRVLKRDHTTVMHGLSAVGPGLWFP